MLAGKAAWAVNKLGLNRDVKEQDSSLLSGHVSRDVGQSVVFSIYTMVIIG